MKKIRKSIKGVALLAVFSAVADAAVLLEISGDFSGSFEPSEENYQSIPSISADFVLTFSPSDLQTSIHGHFITSIYTASGEFMNIESMNFTPTHIGSSEIRESVYFYAFLQGDKSDVDSLYLVDLGVFMNVDLYYQAQDDQDSFSFGFQDSYSGDIGDNLLGLTNAYSLSDGSLAGRQYENLITGEGFGSGTARMRIIPEPSVAWLTGIGGLFFAHKRSRVLKESKERCVL